MASMRAFVLLCLIVVLAGCDFPPMRDAPGAPDSTQDFGQDFFVPAPQWRSGYWWTFEHGDGTLLARFTVLGPVQGTDLYWVAQTPGHDPTGFSIQSSTDIHIVRPALEGTTVQLKDEYGCRDASDAAVGAYPFDADPAACDKVTWSYFSDGNGPFHQLRFPLTPGQSLVTNEYVDHGSCDLFGLSCRGPCGAVVETMHVRGKHVLRGTPMGDLETIQVTTTHESEMCDPFEKGVVEYAPSLQMIVQYGVDSNEPPTPHCNTWPWEPRCGPFTLTAASLLGGHTEGEAEVAHRLLDTATQQRLDRVPRHLPGGPAPQGQVTAAYSLERGFVATWTGSDSDDMHFLWDVLDADGKPVATTEGLVAYPPVHAPGVFFARVTALDWDDRIIDQAVVRFGLDLPRAHLDSAPCETSPAVPRPCPGVPVPLPAAATRIDVWATAAPAVAAASGQVVLADGGGQTKAISEATGADLAVRFELSAAGPDDAKAAQWSLTWQPDVAVQAEIIYDWAVTVDASLVAWPAALAEFAPA